MQSGMGKQDLSIKTEQHVKNKCGAVGYKWLDWTYGSLGGVDFDLVTICKDDDDNDDEDDDISDGVLYCWSQRSS